MIPPPGLAPERTALAWERTALAMLTGGALLAVRHLGDPGSGALVLAVLGVVLALLLAGIGRRRARRLLTDPSTPPRGAVVAGGTAVALFGLAVLGAVLTGALR
ncbi:hypothetical protein GCM10017691_34920 [Pseudonocardia petroleophila]|uniref:DUF202 domain-containing protein n=1 Tax=Pseudonocardia petroleophila TaxID=37331 RepID=A0A7G7MD65_9PSEU|nr:DUF202 domain-containing protein [Pseudonocardia petroleophila]QNG50726.1 DUF202 domain-containing protein [Pseudonocardia petroleophila]